MTLATKSATRLYYLGPPGSHSHTAALSIQWPQGLSVPELIPAESINALGQKVLEATVADPSSRMVDDIATLESDRSKKPFYILVPFENSTCGTVSESLDLMHMFATDDQFGDSSLMEPRWSVTLNSFLWSQLRKLRKKLPKTLNPLLRLLRDFVQ
jgi:hypothetical protein